MAQTRSTTQVPGFSRITQMTGGSAPSGFIMQDSQGYDYYIWVDTSGKWRTTDAATAEAAGFNWNSGGTVIGSQS